MGNRDTPDNWQEIAASESKRMCPLTWTGGHGCTLWDDGHTDHRCCCGDVFRAAFTMPVSRQWIEDHEAWQAHMADLAAQVDWDKAGPADPSEPS
jgi:hypothetical protein